MYISIYKMFLQEASVETIKMNIYVVAQLSYSSNKQWQSLSYLSVFAFDRVTIIDFNLSDQIYPGT